MSRPRTGRPFTLADAMTLIAATAVALPLLKAFFAVWFPTPSPLDRGQRLAVFVGVCSIVLGVLTPAILAIRLAKPRPSWRRVRRQPGFVACGVVLAWGLYEVVLYVTSSLIHPMADFRLIRFAEGLPQWFGPAVAAAWVGLAISGNFRPEPGWVDRAGRAVAAGWLALYALRLACNVLNLL